MKATQETKKNTPLNQHYWTSTGVYQEQYDELSAQLVPARGDSPTIHGEMIRAIGRLYYDFCNNGNCNAIDVEMEDCSECDGCGYEEDRDGETQDCQWCGGDCQVEGSYFITGYYDGMLSFLEQHMTERKLATELREWMINEYQNRYSFSDEQLNVYDKVCDAIIYQCLTTSDKPNPTYKVEA